MTEAKGHMTGSLVDMKLRTAAPSLVWFPGSQHPEAFWLAALKRVCCWHGAAPVWEPAALRPAAQAERHLLEQSSGQTFGQ